MIPPKRVELARSSLPTHHAGPGDWLILTPNFFMSKYTKGSPIGNMTRWMKMTYLMQVEKEGPENIPV